MELLITDSNEIKMSVRLGYYKKIVYIYGFSTYRQINIGHIENFLLSPEKLFLNK